MAPKPGCVIQYTAAGTAIGGQWGFGIGGAIGGVYGFGVGAVPGSTVGAAAGAGVGGATGYAMEQWVCPDDDDDAQPLPNNPPAPNDNSDCEQDCDLKWSRDKFICDSSVATNYGWNSVEYVFCMKRVDKAYVDCVQDCNEEDCNK